MAIEDGPRATTARMPNTDLRVPKTAELVARRLRGQIVRGELVEGDALPSETTLMALFSVSRPTLREAFRVLESESLISVRRGSRGGARVHVPKAESAARYAGLVLEHRRETLAGVYDARAILEPPCAERIAARGDLVDVDRLRRAIEAAEAIDDPMEQVRAQTQFHSLVVELSRNQTMAVLHGMLQGLIDAGTAQRVDQARRGTDPHVAAHTGARAHRRLLELVEAGDAAGAQRLWHRHVTETTEFLLEGTDATHPLDLLG